MSLTLKRISQYTLGGAPNGQELLFITQNGDSFNMTLLMGLTALNFVISLTAGQQDYDLDISRLGLAAAPRFATGILQLIANTDAGFGARLVTTGTTTNLAKIHCDGAPAATGQLLLVTIIP